MKTTSLLVLIILLSTAKASFERKGCGASQIGLSMSGTASHVPEFAAFNNPSLTGGKAAIEVYYRNYYGIKELNQTALYAEFTLWDKAIGCGLARYGNNLYSETELTIATAFHPGPGISLGVCMSLYSLQIKDYGSAFTTGLGLSLLYRINNQIRIAAVISNINEPQIGPSGRIPISGILGISYVPIRDVEILLDSYKEDFFDFTYRFGTRIILFSGVSLLCGLRNQINSFSAGLEINLNNYILKYSVDIHPVLNASHALGIGYVF